MSIERLANDFVETVKHEFLNVNYKVGYLAERPEGAHSVSGVIFAGIRIVELVGAIAAGVLAIATLPFLAVEGGAVILFTCATYSVISYGALVLTIKIDPSETLTHRACRSIFGFFN